MGLSPIQAECQRGPARMWPPGPAPFEAITLGLFSQRLPLIAAIHSCYSLDERLGVKIRLTGNSFISCLVEEAAEYVWGIQTQPKAATWTDAADDPGVRQDFHGAQRESARTSPWSWVVTLGSLGAENFCEFQAWAA